MGSQWLYKPHGVKQTKEFFHFLFHSIKFHFLSPCNLLTCILMALVTQGQKFSCRLSLYMFAPGRETVPSCFLSSPPQPSHRSQNHPPCPCCEFPQLQPSPCEGGKEGLEEAFPQPFVFLASVSKKTHHLIFLLWGMKKQEISCQNTLDWQSVLTSYFQSFCSLLHVPLVSIYKLPVFLRETTDHFLALESTCTNCLGYQLLVSWCEW